MSVVQVVQVEALLQKYVGTDQTVIEVPKSVTNTLNTMAIGDSTFFVLTATNNTVTTAKREVVKYTHTAQLTGTTITVERGEPRIWFTACKGRISGDLTRELTDSWYVTQEQLAGAVKGCNGAPLPYGSAVPTCAQMNDAINSAVPSSLPPSGPAGGALVGDYPNPGLNHNEVAKVFVDCDGIALTPETRLATCTSVDQKLGTKADLVAGIVPANQLPSYVDDVLEFFDPSFFPPTGESGKIYLSTSDNTTYRWTGTQYAKIESGVVLSSCAGTPHASGAQVPSCSEMNAAIATAIANIPGSTPMGWRIVKLTMADGGAQLERTLSAGTNTWTMEFPLPSGDITQMVDGQDVSTFHCTTVVAGATYTSDVGLRTNTTFAPDGVYKIFEKNIATEGNYGPNRLEINNPMTTRASIITGPNKVCYYFAAFSGTENNAKVRPDITLFMKEYVPIAQAGTEVVYDISSPTYWNLP